MGIWESLHKTDFKGGEFDAFRKEAGANSFMLSPQKWIESTYAIGIVSKSGRYGGTFAHSDKKGNIRDEASINELLILANLESYNAILIAQKTQPERMKLLRELAVSQLGTLNSIVMNNHPLIDKNIKTDS